jgi:hypothetical protein
VLAKDGFTLSSLRMVRTGVITGRVVDVKGQPTRTMVSLARASYDDTAQGCGHLKAAIKLPQMAATVLVVNERSAIPLPCNRRSVIAHTGLFNLRR